MNTSRPVKCPLFHTQTPPPPNPSHPRSCNLDIFYTTNVSNYGEKMKTVVQILFISGPCTFHPLGAAKAAPANADQSDHKWKISQTKTIQVMAFILAVLVVHYQTKVTEKYESHPIKNNLSMTDKPLHTALRLSLHWPGEQKHGANQLAIQKLWKGSIFPFTGDPWNIYFTSLSNIYAICTELFPQWSSEHDHVACSSCPLPPVPTFEWACNRRQK